MAADLDRPGASRRPPDLALDDDGAPAHIFASNMLNGTVAPLDAAVSGKGVTLLKKPTRATGCGHMQNMAELVLSPTGLPATSAPTRCMLPRPRTTPSTKSPRRPSASERSAAAS